MSYDLMVFEKVRLRRGEGLPELVPGADRAGGGDLVDWADMEL